ncbi:hypothetical protein Scep_025780 [Stephania cephalantha]|uniref:Uncharacterized protein n=1 Tax=Stephania cephalantha TaxID=152367 RepID=A0AAP0EIW1_9MAGN
MALRRLLYLLHLPLHRPHHLAGSTRPWEPPLERLKCAMELPRSLLDNPLPSPPQEDLGRDEEARPILLDSPLLLSLSAAYDAKACVRYGALMHELRTLGVRLDFVTDEAWNRYRDYWASADLRARSEKASHNEKTENGGPGIGPSKHTGGTQSFRTYEDILALDKDEDDEVTPNDVFLHVHTKDHDGVTFIDSEISMSFHPIDEEQLYYDAAGVCPKGRVYRLGSLARKTRRYADPGASTSQEPMVRRSEFDAVVQRLAQFEDFVQSQLGMCMDFGANASRAPPPPPP